MRNYNYYYWLWTDNGKLFLSDILKPHSYEWRALQVLSIAVHGRTWFALVLTQWPATLIQVLCAVQPAITQPRTKAETSPCPTAHCAFISHTARVSLTPCICLSHHCEASNCVSLTRTMLNLAIAQSDTLLGRWSSLNCSSTGCSVFHTYKW